MSVETVRFYERKGVISQPARPATGFRAYPDAVVAQLGFVHEAKQLGFTLKEIRDLLMLRENPRTDAAAVRGRAAAKLAQIELRMEQFRRMQATLRELLAACPGSGELDQCSILEALSATTRPAAALRPRGTRRSDMKTVELKIQGMHCDGCAKTVEALLAAETGVKAATASYAAGSARVMFDPGAIDVTGLVTAIQRAGYVVKENPA